MTQNNNNLIDANNINKVSKLDYKIVIIGSGAGGSVTAKILSEKGHEVLIVEEGQNFTDHKKVGLSKNLDKWRNYGATPIFSNESIISYAEGKCVGGSTEINGALMWRTPDDVLDKWSKDFEIEDLEANKSDIAQDTDKIIDTDVLYPSLNDKEFNKKITLKKVIIEFIS